MLKREEEFLIIEPSSYNNPKRYAPKVLEEPLKVSVHRAALPMPREEDIGHLMSDKH